MSESHEQQQQQQQHPIAVGYWSIRGLAAPLRMMVLYRNLPLQADNYDCMENSTHDGFDASSWFTKKPDFKAKHPLINLPYVIDGDVIVTQSNACFLYLGRKLALLGKNEVELSQCEQLLCEIFDVRNAVVDYVYPPQHKSGADFFKGITATGKSVDKLNLWLQRKYEHSTSSDSVFFVGEEASAPDFHIWEILDQLRAMAKFFNCEDPLTKFEKLAAFHQFFRHLPGNVKYFESKLSKLPCNNPSAETFGATPEGSKFVFGQLAPWFNGKGIY